MSKHTKGPWCRVSNSIISRKADCVVVRLPACTDSVGDETPGQIERWDADAHLISAAPNLLFALEKVFNTMNDDMPVALRKVCYKAIAMAKGESNE